MIVNMLAGDALGALYDALLYRAIAERMKRDYCFLAVNST